MYSAFGDRDGAPLKLRLLFSVLFVLVAVSGASATLTQWVSHTPREVQQALSNNGFKPGAVDGRWGKKSINALKAFQVSRGLPPSGVVDDATVARLFPNSTSGEILPGFQAQDSKPIDKAEPAASVVEALPVETIEKAGRVEVSPPLIERVEVEPQLEPTGQTVATPNDLQPVREEPGHGVAYAVGAVAAFGLLLIYRRRRSKSLPPIRHEPEGVSDPISSIVKIAATPISEERPAPPQPDFRVSLAAHNENVIAYVVGRGQIGEEPGASVLSESPQCEAISEISLPGISSDRSEQITPPSVPSSISSVPMAFREYDKAERPLFGNIKRADGEGPLSQVRRVSPAFETSQNHKSGWVPKGTVVSVGGVAFNGGMVYVGHYLPKQGSSQENENCLVNPKLGVSRNGDPNGQTMGYWPSYSQISPEARRSYLDWLSGRRDSPGVYIGYVFLYFYGLERRLMLDENQSDSEDVANEVRRLLSVYGGNHSFHRYAHELLSAYELRAKQQAEDFIPDDEGNGYEVPMSLKLALGLRVRDGKPIEPDLLMKFASSHPETRVRTPARRAPDLLRELFFDEMKTRYPDGLRVAAGRYKALKASYRACSGSFTIEVTALGGSVPDVSDRAEPITTARTIFEACSDKLDDYSRVLGRSPGLRPTLAAVAKLPSSLRRRAAERLDGGQIGTLAALASDGKPVVLRDLVSLLALETGSAFGKTKLRELSQLLGSFGYGSTADPAYSLRLTTTEDPVLLFPISEAETQGGEPSQSYRSIQLSVMLGLVIGYADGHLDDTERKSLHGRIENANGIDPSERSRLKAEVALIELDATRLEEWSKRLKDVPVGSREHLASELVGIAAADGSVHPAEIKKLEILFKRMGLDPQSLYHLLHDSSSVRLSDDELSVIIEATEGPIGVPIPPEPAKPSGTRIDLNRLNAIRSETRITASVLSEIFVEEEPTVEAIIAPEPVTIDDGGVFDGLERRYGFLVGELATQTSWSGADFDNLVRSAGLMPGAAREAINDWALDHFDELFIEDDDPVVINSYLLPNPSFTLNISESISA